VKSTSTTKTTAFKDYHPGDVLQHLLMQNEWLGRLFVFIFNLTFFPNFFIIPLNKNLIIIQSCQYSFKTKTMFNMTLNLGVNFRENSFFSNVLLLIAKIYYKELQWAKNGTIKI
jgi:hypothetical protein